MPSLLAERANCLRRLGAAALLAATALVGTTSGTVGDPATACAKPRFNKGSYEQCVAIYRQLLVDGEITTYYYDKKVKECCEGNGGDWYDDLEGGAGECVDPAELEAEAPATLAPPAPPGGPIAPSPGNPTVAPPAPTATLIPQPAPPPAQIG